MVPLNWAGSKTMAQDLIFWGATASVCMVGVLFVALVALKQLIAYDDPD